MADFGTQLTDAIDKHADKIFRCFFDYERKQKVLAEREAKIKRYGHDFERRLYQLHNWGGYGHLHILTGKVIHTDVDGFEIDDQYRYVKLDFNPDDMSWHLVAEKKRSGKKYDYSDTGWENLVDYFIDNKIFNFKNAPDFELEYLRNLDLAPVFDEYIREGLYSHSYDLTHAEEYSSQIIYSLDEFSKIALGRTLDLPSYLRPKSNENRVIAASMSLAKSFLFAGICMSNRGYFKELTEKVDYNNFNENFSKLIELAEKLFPDIQISYLLRRPIVINEN